MGKLRSRERRARLEEVELQGLDRSGVQEKRGLTRRRNVMFLTTWNGDLSQHRLGSFPWHLQDKLCSPCHAVEVCRQLGNRLGTRSTKHRKPNLHHQLERGDVQMLEQVRTDSTATTGCENQGTLAIYQRKKPAVGV